jgi:NAD+ diphosphatase
MKFLAHVEDADQENIEGIWFVFRGDQLLVLEREAVLSIPGAEILQLGIMPTDVHILGKADGVRCLIGHTSSDVTPEGYAWIHPRILYGKLDMDWIWLVFRAFHVMSWLMKTRFCGVCGTKLGHSKKERAMVCPSCGNIMYPRISPAVIVMILRGDEILLAHSNRFPEGLYSNVAGFVEAGETLEDCVRREVREEVGLELGEIRYFSSQPWPFPDSLMVGFVAEYLSGEIRVDGEEIADAKWFTRETIPNLPGPLSIARKMIDSYLKVGKKQNQ